MGLLDSISEFLIDPVDTSGATSAVNQGADSALGRLQGNISASDDVRNRLLQLFQDPGSFSLTPGSQFAFDQGISALDRSAAARGQLGSGNQLRELKKFGQGVASQDRRNEINSLLGFLSQTNPANQSAASIDVGRGDNLASIGLGAENARVAGSNSLLKGAFTLGGAALGSF